MDTSKTIYDNNKIERKWLDTWENTLYMEDNPYTKSRKDDSPKYFAMDTFAYPSAEGIHVGYIESYGATDMIVRYHRMNGYNVFYPMGYDTFGLPAENYAIKNKIHPKDATDESINNFHQQYRRIGLSYDKSTYINTADIGYYRWTQWLFLKLYEAGLAYRDTKKVSYCPECKTVISKEQVIQDGKCERCSSEITIKEMKQWYFRITEYADRLDKNIDTLDWPESGKNIHKHWIGKSVKDGKVSFRLHDWCISRQRYWGTPIPIVYCDNCGEQPIPFDNLPVELPYDVDYMPTGVPPLQKNIEFYEGGTCPKCEGPAKREVDVMDTFVSSAWYMYRYLDPNNTDEAFSIDKIADWFPIDWYQGAREHYTAHLIYTRFIALFLYDKGYIDTQEPVKYYVGCGLVTAKDGARISKRLANAPDLQENIEKYGADTLRLFAQFAAPFEDDVPWDTDVIPGVQRFLNRVYRIAVNKVTDNTPEVTNDIVEAFNTAHKTISKGFKEYRWNVAISRIMDLIRAINKYDEINSEFWDDVIKLLSPFTPFIAEELWEMNGHATSVHLEEYPHQISNDIKKDMDIIVSVNGKKRETIKCHPDTDEIMIHQEAVSSVSQYGVTTSTKYIYVKNRIINFTI